MILINVVDGVGSPPRAWGQWCLGGAWREPRRFTPTGVGTMLGGRQPQFAAPVHPHGRGDNQMFEKRRCISNGSPPRAWGQSAVGLAALAAGRFTPTGVGTMVTQDADSFIRSVHPHGRGDNLCTGIRSISVTGSPPRAWGQSLRGGGLSGWYRFTPTGVGTIAGNAAKRYANTVHPHGRGDNARAVAPGSCDAGSPPRAWGQLPADNPVPLQARFTPTGVGTMYRMVNRTTLTTVHPHGRGDNRVRRFLRAGSPGSPPRAWGQLAFRRRLAFFGRFTPTGVGTMSLVAQILSVLGVHPHGRGDN